MGSRLNPFSSSSPLNPTSLVTNPLPGITGGLLGSNDPIVGGWVGERLGAANALNSALLSLDRDKIKSAYKDFDAYRREDAGKAIDALQGLNNRAIDVAMKPASRVVSKAIGDKYGMKGYNDLRGLNALASGDARLLNSTRNLRTGVANKADRVENTRQNAEAVNMVRQAGAMAAATGIPIVSWIGLAANAAMNQRLREAELISSRQGIANLGTAALGAYAGAQGPGGISPTQQVGMGAARGAINAYGNDGNVLRGAVAGGLTSYGGLLGADIGGPVGAGVSGAIGGTANAWAAGARGSDLVRAGVTGGLSPMASGYAGGLLDNPYWRAGVSPLAGNLTAGLVNRDIRSGAMRGLQAGMQGIARTGARDLRNTYFPRG